MAILWGDELPRCDGVTLDGGCAAVLGDRLRAHLRRIGRTLSAGLAGISRALDG